MLAIGVLGTGLWADSLWAVFALGTLATAAAWSLSTLLPLWVARVAPQHERGRMLGWIHLWWNLAMIVGSTAGGYLYDRGPGLPFLFSSALVVASIPLSLLFFRMQANAPSPTP